MNQLELIGIPQSPYVQRAVIVLLEKALDYKFTCVNVYDKPDWFIKIAPLGLVPVLKINNRAIFESCVICQYLDDITGGTLQPDNALEKAVHLGWIEYSNTIINGIQEFYRAANEAVFEKNSAALMTKFEVIERVIQGDPYFTGEDFLLVDAVYGPVFRYFDAFNSIRNFGFFNALPKVSRWKDNLLNRPSIKQAVPDDYRQQLFSYIKTQDGYLASLITD